jgi:hypothetical protein
MSIMAANCPKRYFKVSAKVIAATTIDSDAEELVFAVAENVTNDETKSSSNVDYLLELAVDWDCIDTGKEWLVQDCLDNIHVRRVDRRHRLESLSCV